MLGSGGGGAPGPRCPRAPPPPAATRPPRLLCFCFDGARVQLARVESRAVGGRGLGLGDARVPRSGLPRRAAEEGARGRVPQTDPDRVLGQGRFWWGSWELILGEQYSDVAVKPTAL